MPPPSPRLQCSTPTPATPPCNWAAATRHSHRRPLRRRPNGFQIDPANATLYTANYDDTISAWDLAACNASDLALCASQTPGTVSPTHSKYLNALWLVVDVALHSVYVTYQQDDAVFVVDTNVCNGSHLAACATLNPP